MVKSRESSCCEEAFSGAEETCGEPSSSSSSSTSLSSPTRFVSLLKGDDDKLEKFASNSYKEQVKDQQHQQQQQQQMKDACYNSDSAATGERKGELTTTRTEQVTTVNLIAPTACGKIKKAQKPRRRVATLAQRRAANIRERRRMFNLNAAFDRLRKKVPSFAYEKRLSRIETLKLAIMYIRFMDDLVNDEVYAEKYKQLTALTNPSMQSNLTLSGTNNNSTTSFLSSNGYLSSLYGHCINDSPPPSSLSTAAAPTPPVSSTTTQMAPPVERQPIDLVNQQRPLIETQCQRSNSICLGTSGNQFRSRTLQSSPSGSFGACNLSPSSSSVATTFSATSSSTYTDSPNSTSPLLTSSLNQQSGTSSSAHQKQLQELYSTSSRQYHYQNQNQNHHQQQQYQPRGCRQVTEQLDINTSNSPQYYSTSATVGCSSTTGNQKILYYNTEHESYRQREDTYLESSNCLTNEQHNTPSNRLNQQEFTQVSHHSQKSKQNLVYSLHSLEAR